MLKSTDITNAGFAITKFREGYEQSEVDELLDRATAALAAWETGQTATIASTDVNALLFRTTKFGNGYDQDQVDDFLDQIVASLVEHESAPASVVVTDDSPIRSPGQTPLEPASLLRSSTVLDKTFAPTRLREGYSVEGVDGFLATVRTVIAGYERGAMATEAPALTAEDVVNVRFKPTRFKRGYSQDDVDDYLDEIVATIRHYEQAPEQR